MVSLDMIGRDKDMGGSSFLIPDQRYSIPGSPTNQFGYNTNDQKNQRQNFRPRQRTDDLYPGQGSDQVQPRQPPVPGQPRQPSVPGQPRQPPVQNIGINLRKMGGQNLDPKSSEDPPKVLPVGQGCHITYLGSLLK